MNMRYCVLLRTSPWNLVHGKSITFGQQMGNKVAGQQDFATNGEPGLGCRVGSVCNEDL
jgi:hypothetical protein